MKKYGLLILLLIASIFTGCHTPVMVESSMEQPRENLGMYSLSPLDPILITLLGIPEEKLIEAVIDEKGQITLPYIEEPVQATGMSTSELERKIQNIYTEGQIYRNVTVNIQTSGKIYYMEGEVARPQEYALSRRITLLQAIAAAGGYTEYADRKDVTITRRGQIMKFNTKKLEKTPELDVPIEAGDRIKVDRSFY